MTRVVLIFLCAIIGSFADPQCNGNEILDNCPRDCQADYCPKSEAEALQGCPSAPSPCPPPTCKCRINTRYASASNKTCIPTRECPPFECNRPNEEFNPCPPYCPSDSCTQATPDGSCPRLLGRIGTLLICSPKCRCIKNYWRQNGVCVPYTECPQNQSPASDDVVESPTPDTVAPGSPANQVEPEEVPQGDVTSYASAAASADDSPEECGSSSDDETCSGPNEEYVLEKQTCPPELCSSITARINCTGEPPPQPGCACKSGFFRLNESEPCMDICDCPQMAYTLECLGLLLLY